MTLKRRPIRRTVGADGRVWYWCDVCMIWKLKKEFTNPRIKQLLVCKKCGGSQWGKK